MILFNDLVIKKDVSPVVKIFSKRLNSRIDICFNDKNIYSDEIKSESLNIKLVSFESDLVELKINIDEKYDSTLTILKLDENEPYIICDIDFTIAKTNLIYFVMNKILKIKTMIKSIEVLNEISKDYKIIYLTGRTMNHFKATKKWIDINGFPKGPIITRPNHYFLTQAKFKFDFLSEITKISKNGVGIGDLSSDINAYISNGLKAIKIKNQLFGSSKKDLIVNKNGFNTVYSWESIKKLQMNNFNAF